MPIKEATWADEGGEDFDYSKVKDGPPPPLPDALYNFEVVKAEARPTSNGNGSVNLTCKALRAYGSDDPITGFSKTVYDNVVITADSLWRVKALAEAAGVEAPRNGGQAATEEFANDLVGHTFWGKTKLDEFKGKVRAKMNGYVGEEGLQEAAEAMSKGDAAGGDESDRPSRKRR